MYKTLIQLQDYCLRYQDKLNMCNSIIYYIIYIHMYTKHIKAPLILHSRNRNKLLVCKWNQLAFNTYCDTYLACAHVQQPSIDTA